MVSLPLPRKESRQQRYPVYCGGMAKEGTVYLVPGHLSGRIVQHGRAGKAWKYFRSVTTYQPNTQVTYKNISRLPVENEEDFWNVQRSCFKAGVNPPTSFADIFQQVFPSRMVQPTVKAAFLHHSPSSLQKAFTVGKVEGKVYHYDLNSAYRWASTEGLPDLRTARRILRVEDQWDLATVDLAEPLPYSRKTVGVVISRQELEQYGAKIVAYHYGLKFRSWLDLKGLWETIEQHFPYCFKRIGRAFWGRWNTKQAVEMVSWSGGQGKMKTTALKNPFHNPIWAHYIVSRVISRCLAVPELLHVSHDSILTRQELPTGDKPGCWRCEHELKDLRIYRTNLWGEGDGIIKHSGLTPERASQWLTKKLT